MSFQVRGRPKSSDQILMAIRALTLEWETRINNMHPISKDTQILLREIKSCWGLSTEGVARVWIDKVNEIDEELHKVKMNALTSKTT